MVSGLPAFIGCRSDPAVAWFHRCSDFSRPDAEAFLAGQPGLIFEADGHWFQWALERDEDGVLAGDAAGDAAVHFFDQGRRGELGVTLALEWHDRGYAQEALVSMLERLLLQRGRHRVMRQVDSRHAPIQALLRRLGFRGEGMIGRAVFCKGTWLYGRSDALLAGEWPVRASRFRGLAPPSLRIIHDHDHRAGRTAARGRTLGLEPVIDGSHFPAPR